MTGCPIHCVNSFGAIHYAQHPALAMNDECTCSANFVTKGKFPEVFQKRVVVARGGGGATAAAGGGGGAASAAAGATAAAGGGGGAASAAAGATAAAGGGGGAASANILQVIDENTWFQKASYKGRTQTMKFKEALDKMLVNGASRALAEMFKNLSTEMVSKTMDPVGGINCWLCVNYENIENPYGAVFVGPSRQSRQYCMIEFIVTSQKKSRPHGILESLMKKVFHYAHKKKYKGVDLEVANVGTAAGIEKLKKLYESFGFEKSRRSLPKSIGTFDYMSISLV